MEIEDMEKENQLYCRLLKNFEIARKESLYSNEAEDAYICSITGKDCVGKVLYEVNKNGRPFNSKRDKVTFFKPKIDFEQVRSRCPVNNSIEKLVEMVHNGELFKLYNHLSDEEYEAEKAFVSLLGAVGAV